MKQKYDSSCRFNLYIFLSSTEDAKNALHYIQSYIPT